MYKNNLVNLIRKRKKKLRIIWRSELDIPLTRNGVPTSATESCALVRDLDQKVMKAHMGGYKSEFLGLGFCIENS